MVKGGEDDVIVESESFVGDLVSVKVFSCEGCDKFGGFVVRVVLCVD